MLLAYAKSKFAVQEVRIQESGFRMEITQMLLNYFLLCFLYYSDCCLLYSGFFWVVGAARLNSATATDFDKIHLEFIIFNLEHWRNQPNN